jgi:hypothetical protein
MYSTSIISIVKEQKTNDMNQRAEVRANLEIFQPPTGRAYSMLQKGGDPAAGSPTATLLRLRPSH